MDQKLHIYRRQCLDRRPPSKPRLGILRGEIISTGLEERLCKKIQSSWQMKHCGSWRVPYLSRAPCVQVASSLGMQDCQSGTNAGPRKALQDLVIDDADHVPIPFQ